MIDRMLNKIARLTNKWIMLVLALMIAVLLFTSTAEGVMITLWILFILTSLIFSINGFLLFQGFNRAVNDYMKEGKTIKGIQGFEELVESLKGSRSQSYMITIASIFAFVIYNFQGLIDELLSGSETGDGIEGLGKTLAISMAFIAIAVMFLVDYPEDPSLTPGGLIGYYEPDVFPLTLDNILSDVFATYMDPATYMKYDEWSGFILEWLDPEYEDDEFPKTRLERAREKILLLAYLSYSNPEAFTKEVIDRELAELFGDKLDGFKKGEGTGLEWKEITSIMQKVENNAPEPFRLVDRLLVNLTDNYEEFVSDDLYFTVSAKTNQGSVTESTGAIAFLLNKTSKEGRMVNVRYVTDRQTMHPYRQEVTIELDPLTDPFPEKQPELVGEGFDILSILSSLLQVGDAVWFRIQPRGFGYRLVTVYASEQGVGKTMGASFEVKFTKALSWYVKAYAPRLSALGSMALPFIQSVF